VKKCKSDYELHTHTHTHIHTTLRTSKQRTFSLEIFFEDGF